ncbi:hypothetical protein SRHO_G00327700 [Serrasalmus rhombeus]
MDAVTGELEGTPGWRSQHQPVGDISSIRPLHFVDERKQRSLQAHPILRSRGVTHKKRKRKEGSQEADKEDDTSTQTREKERRGGSQEAD